MKRRADRTRTGAAQQDEQTADAFASLASEADKVAARNARAQYRRVCVDRDRANRWAMYRWVAVDRGDAP